MEIALFAFLFFFLGSVAYSVLRFAPWVPSRGRDIERVMALARIQNSDVFYDLGCGDGRLVFAAAQHGARAIGVEVALPLYFVCKIRQICNRQHTAEFRFADMFRVVVSDATVVYLFGMPDTLKDRCRKKLERELAPGTRVISYSFAIDGWEPVVVDRPSGTDLPIYLYHR